MRDVAQEARVDDHRPAWRVDRRPSDKYRDPAEQEGGEQHYP
jgi:hypothetical protein